MDTNGNYIQTQFCSYEIALKLRELGFDKECFKVYDILGFLQIEAEMIQLKLEFVKAPLWQQAIDWFRIKHKIDIFVNPIETMLFPKRTYQSRVLTKTSITIGGAYDIYEKAREQAILKAIELCQKK